MLHLLPSLVTDYKVGKVRRGNYVFITWKGDHSPRHVHVYKDGEFVVKWNLDARLPMKGRLNARLLQLIDELDRDGIL